MQKSDYPILEFDSERKAIFEPGAYAGEADIPEHVVLCFFHDVIASIAEKHDATVPARPYSEMGGHPLFAQPVVDAGYHDAWAERIVNGDWLGHGPDDVFKPPLYSYFVAVVYALGGLRISVVQLVQLVLGRVQFSR